MHCHSNSRAKVAEPPVSTRKVGPCRFPGKIILTRVPVFSPKTLPVEAVRFPAPEIGNDMFHPLTIYGHENKGMYRKTQDSQMDKDYGIGHCRLHRVQLSPLKRNIARMGGSRHRVFQGILQVFI